MHYAIRNEISFGIILFHTKRESHFVQIESHTFWSFHFVYVCEWRMSCKYTKSYTKLNMIYSCINHAIINHWKWKTVNNDSLFSRVSVMPAQSASSSILNFDNSWSNLRRCRSTCKENVSLREWMLYEAWDEATKDDARNGDEWSKVRATSPRQSTRRNISERNKTLYFY